MQILATETFAAPLTAFTEPCGKCSGTGRFVGYTGKDLGECFTCKGAGKMKSRAYLDAVRNARAKPVQDDALRAAFDKLLASGLKYPKLRMQGFAVKPAPAKGKHPGALYVKQGETYLGMVLNGRFDSTSACTTETADKVAALIADPMAAIKAYGVETGQCALCGLELTDPVSIARGVGPICAGRL